MIETWSIKLCSLLVRSSERCQYLNVLVSDSKTLNIDIHMIHICTEPTILDVLNTICYISLNTFLKLYCVLVCVLNEILKFKTRFYSLNTKLKFLVRTWWQDLGRICLAPAPCFWAQGQGFRQGVWRGCGDKACKSCLRLYVMKNRVLTLNLFLQQNRVLRLVLFL